MARRTSVAVGFYAGASVLSKVTYEDLLEGAQARFLSVMGAFHPKPEDRMPGQTVVLLGPSERGFWDEVTGSPEFKDGRSDPLDRWSRRVIGTWACDLGAKALFPFGEPIQPFYSFALRSGRAWASPVSWLVHDTAGLLASYRGALALPNWLNLPDRSDSPCLACAKPCSTACPVAALTPSGYDVPACKAFVRSAGGRDCRENGCLVRRACPLSQTYSRDQAQSAYHMEVFLG